MNRVINKVFDKDKLKKRLPYSLLAGITFSFMFFFFGIMEIFSGNRDEFLFSVNDFVGYLIIIAVCTAVFIAALIELLPENAARVVFGAVVWITLAGYIQMMFFNGSAVLNGDGDTVNNEKLIMVIADTAMWTVTGVAVIAGAFFMKKKDILKKVFIICLIALFVMQASVCAVGIGNITRSSTKNLYLNKKGLDEVSNGKNVVVFIVDRFDVSYYDKIISKEPGYFEDLDGFTFFYDNISLYSRTWPAVTTMITGIDNDFTESREKYFEKAYPESPFLKDLKANDYRIKLYTASYYAYRDGTPLAGIADNISNANGYTITSTPSLLKNLIKLSLYRYAPDVLKDFINVSTSSFTGLVKYDSENNAYPMYEINDPVVCGQILDNGLSFDGDGNSFILIHLNGCHSPYNMDENAEKSEVATGESQFRGCFKTIKYYLEEMKRLGVYDDSTIIITGDHPRARNDSEIPSQPRLTALFVKPPKASGKLAYSSAQVSQENLIPTIIKSSGIKTEVDYGLSYFEVPPDKDNVRYHKFELSGEPNQIIKFKITGDGRDFGNWLEESRITLKGSFYN